MSKLENRVEGCSFGCIYTLEWSGTTLLIASLWARRQLRLIFAR